MLVQPVSTNPNVLSPRRGHTAIKYNDTKMIIFGGRQLYHTLIGIAPNNNLSANAVLLIDTTSNNVTSQLTNQCTSSNVLNSCNNYGTCTYTISSTSSTSLTTTSTSYTLPQVLSLNLTQYDSQNMTSSCQCNTGYTGTICQSLISDIYYNDIGIYDIIDQTWNILQPDPPGTLKPVPWPEPRYQHTAALLNNSTMVIYGGYSQYCVDYCQPVWEYNLLSNDTQGRGIWTMYNFINATANPGGRWQHMSTVYSNEMYIYGGFQVSKTQGSMFLNDMYKYVIINSSARAWVRILNNTLSSTVPCVRSSAGASLYGETWYIYGGFTVPLNQSASYNIMSTTSSYFLSDLWSFNLITLQWAKVTQPSDSIESPPAMYGTRMRFTPDGILLLFGGYSNNLYHSDIWRFNTTSSYWTRQIIDQSFSSTPAARSDHAWLYYDNINNGTYILFGGYGFGTNITTTSTIVPDITYSESYYNDIWQFQLSSCPGACNGRGICSYGYCYCADGYYGTDCQQTLCISDICIYDNRTQVASCTHCSNTGTCLFGTCLCQPQYTGAACNTPTCTNNCTSSIHGACITDTNTNTASCVCNDKWYGVDCSEIRCSSTCNSPAGGYCDTSVGNCVCYTSLVGEYNGIGCATYIATP